MAQQKRGRRSRHVPQRTCVACRRTDDKRTLVRIVRTAEGVVVDPTGKLAGRGAYLCQQEACWRRALDGGLLQRALRARPTDLEQATLESFAAELPVESEPASAAADAQG